MKFRTFGRAVYEGLIDGPSGCVFDQDGSVLDPQIETLLHTFHSRDGDTGTVDVLKRELTYNVLSLSGVKVGKVTDYQQRPFMPRTTNMNQQAAFVFPE